MTLLARLSVVSIVSSALFISISEAQPAVPNPATPSKAEAVATSVDWHTSENRTGLRCISDHTFPAMPGTISIPVPGGTFETDGKVPAGWQGKLATDGDAPQGKAYLKIEAVKGSGLRTVQINAESGKPYFLSFLLKSPAEHWANIAFTSNQRLRSFTDEFPSVPGTGNQWKHVGIYFWMPSPSTTIQLNILPRNEPMQPGEFICLDDVRLRTATESEMAAAYEAERLHYPPFDVTARPGDGGNLALSVAKWEGRAGLPGKPFVIWAIGSSWTAAQKNGYGLVHAIRKNFPQAPEIIYQEHDGAGTPWDYATGWVKQFVAAEQPDLIFTYTVGTAEGLDELLTEIRRRTTADIIVPSIHFQVGNQMIPDEIENGFVSWEKIREICRRHHAEFVEHRRDLAEYMKRNGIMPDDLLWDHVHQNEHGRIRIWDSVSRHITHPAQFTYLPESLERRIPAVPDPGTTMERVSLSGGWRTSEGVIASDAAGDRVRVEFTGNRIDVIGRAAARGGSVTVFIDGVPADQAPSFRSNYIRAIPKIYPKAHVSGQAGDTAPQAIELGSALVPQSWTLTMTSDSGDYRLEGSVTGPDGEGNVTRFFWSKSGQIGINPKQWRNGVLTKRGPPVQYGNVAGDAFVFDVERSAESPVSFAGAGHSIVSHPLAQNLPIGRHTLELVASGEGRVEIEAFYVFCPMEQ